MARGPPTTPRSFTAGCSTCAIRNSVCYAACAGHTHEKTHADITIQTCWDADRLDLGRVGIRPDPTYLGTTAARRPDTISWADARAWAAVVPEFVKRDWGIDLADWPRHQTDPAAGWTHGAR